MALRGNPIGHLYPGLTAEALPTPKLISMAHHDVHVGGYGGITDKRNRQVVTSGTSPEQYWLTQQD